MTRKEYERMISKIAGQIQDLRTSAQSLLDDIDKLESTVEYLPELDDLEEEKKEDA